MANDPSAQATGPDGQLGHGRSRPPWHSYRPPLLVIPFDLGTLGHLRAKVQAFAARASLPDHRIGDLVLAIHELAANAVQHGAGSGLLRVWRRAGALWCRVDDGEVPAFAGDETPYSGSGPASLPGAPGDTMLNSLCCVPGHGLWMVRQVVDQMQTRSGPHGTSVLISVGPVQ